jgi:hypothetical protein
LAIFEKFLFDYFFLISSEGFLVKKNMNYQAVVVESDDNKIDLEAEEFRKEASVKAPEGSISLTVVFTGIIKGKATPGKKAPPMRFNAVVTQITKLASHTNNPGYKVEDQNTILIPHYNTTLIRSIKKELDEKRKRKELVTTEDEQRLFTAQQTIKQWTKLRDGTSIVCSTFDRAGIADFKSLQVLTLIGFHGEFSEVNTDTYVNYSCSKAIPKATTAPPYVELSRLLSLETQTTIEFPEPEDKYGKQYLLCFSNYKGDEIHGQPLHVIQRRYTIDTDPSRYKVTKDGIDKIHYPMTIFQKQSDGIGYWINAVIFDQDLLNEAFGIPDKDLFAKIMPNHPVSLLAACSINLENTRSFDNSDEDKKRITVWVNSAKFLTRDYVLGQCPQITFQEVKNRLCDDPDDEKRAFVEHGSTIMNQMNLDKASKFIRDKIVNVSFYTGDLNKLNAQGCQWRVMSSKNNTEYERHHIADLTPEEGNKHIDGSYVIYAVMPFTSSELKINDQGKRERSESDDEDQETEKKVKIEEEDE